MLFYPFQLLLPQKHPGAQGAQVGGPRPAWGLQAKGRNPWNLWGCDSDFARIFTHLHHDLRGKTHEILGFMSISPEFEQGSKRGNKLETSEKMLILPGFGQDARKKSMRTTFKRVWTEHLMMIFAGFKRAQIWKHMGFKIVDMGKSGTYLANMLFRILNIILKQQRIYIYRCSSCAWRHLQQRWIPINIVEEALFERKLPLHSVNQHVDACLLMLQSGALCGLIWHTGQGWRSTSPTDAGARGASRCLKRTIWEMCHGRCQIRQWYPNISQYIMVYLTMSKL